MSAKEIKRTVFKKRNFHLSGVFSGIPSFGDLPVASEGSFADPGTFEASLLEHLEMVL